MSGVIEASLNLPGRQIALTGEGCSLDSGDVAQDMTRGVAHVLLASFGVDGTQIIHQLHDARCSLILQVQLYRVDNLSSRMVFLTRTPMKEWSSLVRSSFPSEVVSANSCEQLTRCLSGYLRPGTTMAPRKHNGFSANDTIIAARKDPSR